MTGKEAVTTADITADISVAIGAEVTAVVQPLSEAFAGADPWIAEVIGGMFGRVHDGTFATVSDTVEKITGARRAPSRGSSPSTPTSGASEKHTRLQVHT